MSPKRASAATLAAAALVAAFGAGLAGPAAAWPFGRSERPAAAAADPSAAPAHAAAAPAAQAEAPPQPAGPVERAQADRLDPLARSVFWTREHQVAPNDTVATLSLSRALRDLGQYDQAVAAASEVLVIEPGSVEARLEIGRAHIARGQAFYAVEPLEQAQAAQANDWRILSLLGVAYEQVQRTEDARQAWTQALALSPENPAVLSNMALSLASTGDAGQAEQLLRRAAAQPGATLQVRQNLALVLGLQGKTGEAEAILRRAMPPEAAEQNLAWIRGAATPVSNTTADGGRSWGEMGG